MFSLEKRWLGKILLLGQLPNRRAQRRQRQAFLRGVQGQDQKAKDQHEI